jgi:hypothetical protein
VDHARNASGRSARHARDRQSIEVRGASVFEFTGTRIRRCTDYWDMVTFLKQLGLI